MYHGHQEWAKSRLGAREGFTLEIYHEMLSKQSRVILSWVKGRVGAMDRSESQ